MYGSSQYGSAQYGELDRVINAIEKAQTIPRDAKDAIKDFIADTFNELWQQAQDLMSIAYPESLHEHWNVVLEIIKSITIAN
ncbi:conserved hypothetical protein [Vibrio chagasii]|nr:conserved hypothetical protein [Vibrio chagasii]